MRKWLLALSIGFTLLFVAACDAQIVPVNSTTTVSTTALPSYTLLELAQFDGLSGHKGYIAVDGWIYDVTNVFPGGKHQGIQLAGTDATSVFASSPHSQELLSSLPLVGRLTSGSATTTTTTTTTETTTTQTGLPVFTAVELAAYDGKNGSPAYVAVHGIVYDLSAVFANGMHQGIQMGGTDATVHFESSPHSLSILEGMPVVGTFSSGATNETNPTLPVFTLAQLSQYTGAGGTTAYVAVDGVVYDVTGVFTNGIHRGMQLGGTDASAIFASSPHSSSLLSGLPVVGSLEGAPTIPADQGNSGSGTSDDDCEDDEDEEEHEDEGDIASADLPEPIRTYLAANYPAATIREAEWEDGIYEIELSNGLELKFDQNGQFLSSEWDD